MKDILPEERGDIQGQVLCRQTEEPFT